MLQGGDPNDVFSLSDAEGVRYEKLYKKYGKIKETEKINTLKSDKYMEDTENLRI